jgi:NADPH:quinone reductase-like Zn-dependent oxidoreductase
MRAMLFRRFGPPDVLEQATIDIPRPGPGAVLVQVAAVGIGRLLDLTARAGDWEA